MSAVLAAIGRMLDSYPFELVIIVNLFMWSYPRRSWFLLRMIGMTIPMLVIYDACGQIFPNGLTPSEMIDRLFFLIPIGYTWLIMRVCYRCTAAEALLSTATAHPAQNIVFNVYWIIKMYLGFAEGSLGGICVSFSLMALVYPVVFFTVGRYLTGWNRSKAFDRRLLINAVLITLIVNILNQRAAGARWEVTVYLSYVISDILALMMQYGLLQESDLERRYGVVEQLLYAEQKKQQMTAENVELINRKCHDLKHQLRALRRMEPGEEQERYIRQIEDAVLFYESAVKTGNETLDLILMDKLLYCQEHEIKLTCVGDGEKLSVLDTMDIYALFGNALDNAIESVMGETQRERRIVSFRIGSRGDFISIHFENYLGHPVKLSKGLPVTTKADSQYHGFGMLSIRHIVQKYNGSMSVRTDDNLFRLDILIPTTPQAPQVPV